MAVTTPDAPVPVVAVVTTSGGTGRGVKAGSKEELVRSRYKGESASEKPFDAPDGKHYQIRRYDSLGLAFEIQNGVVHHITLYPAKSP